MTHQVQIELAKNIEILRNNPSWVGPFADWLDENNISSQQFREAMKLILVAHSSIAMVDRKKRKFYGHTYYFTKFKIVNIVQMGFSYKIRISKRKSFMTNKWIQANSFYKNLLKPCS